jgi:hypothetical protein
MIAEHTAIIADRYWFNLDAGWEGVDDPVRRVNVVFIAIVKISLIIFRI